MDLKLIVLGLGVLGVLTFALRFVWAWMFRINEVITLLSQILAELKKQNNEK